jgi:hypothetical protein
MFDHLPNLIKLMTIADLVKLAGMIKTQKTSLLHTCLDEEETRLVLSGRNNEAAQELCYRTGLTLRQSKEVVERERTNEPVRPS